MLMYLVTLFLWYERKCLATKGQSARMTKEPSGTPSHSSDSLSSVMFSLQGERRRRINLGGVSATSSQASILERVHAQRQARAENKRRTDCAVKIQAWYRGLKEARVVRRELRKLFLEDVQSLTALRCLVLIGRDDEVLSTWVTSVLVDEGCSCDLSSANFSNILQVECFLLRAEIKNITGLFLYAKRAFFSCNRWRLIPCELHGIFGG